MPFQRDSLSTITDRITSDITTRMDDATSFLRRSVLRVIAKVLAGAFHLLYEYLDYQARQLFISTADDEGVSAHLSEYGLSKDDGTKATGSGTVTGTNGVVIPADTELTRTDDVVYLVDANVTIASGTGTLAFTAEEIGEDGNDDPSIILSFVSPIIGVSTTVTVDSNGITGGVDEETVEESRTKGLARKRQPPHGGAYFDYEKWCLENDGVTRSWTVPLYQGAGTIGVSFVRDNDTSIIPNTAQLAAVRSYIIEHTDPASGLTVGAPVTANPGLFMLELSLKTIDFSIQLYPNTTAVQTTVTTNLTDLILRSGGPEETLYYSKIVEAVSLAVGEEYSKVTVPAYGVDTTMTSTQVAVLGTITFSEYI